MMPKLILGVRPGKFLDAYGVCDTLARHAGVPCSIQLSEHKGRRSAHGRGLQPPAISEPPPSCPVEDGNLPLGAHPGDQKRTKMIMLFGRVLSVPGNRRASTPDMQKGIHFTCRGRKLHPSIAFCHPKITPGDDFWRDADTTPRRATTAIIGNLQPRANPQTTAAANMPRRCDPQLTARTGNPCARPATGHGGGLHTRADNTLKPDRCGPLIHQTPPSDNDARLRVMTTAKAGRS
jgi:hypothetical protein